MISDTPAPDDLPDLPPDYIQALEEGRDLPELPPVQAGMTDRQFTRYAELRRAVDQFPALLKLAIATAKKKQAADEARERWLRSEAIRYANEHCVRGRSFTNVSQAISGKLRKVPTTLAYDESQEGAFLMWDFEHKHAFTRFKLRVKDLSYDAMEMLKALLPKELQGAVFVEVEPELAQVKAHWKATGEVPPGFKVVESYDTISIDQPKLEAPKDGEVDAWTKAGDESDAKRLGEPGEGEVMP